MSSALFMGAPYEVPAFETRTLIDSFAATGHNTGNLLIGNGLYQQLAYDSLTPYRGAMTAEFVNESFDQIVIAAANFLYPGFDFSYLSSFLERVDLPVFMVGLGAQLPSSSSELKDIPAGTWRLVELASERSTSVGVRGEFTADLLARRGIKNARVMGCPSLYTNLSATTKIRRPETAERIVLNGSRNVVAHSSDPAIAKRVEVQLLNWAMQHEAAYVLQNEQPEMQLAAGEDMATHASQLASLSTFFGQNAEDLARFYRTNAVTFFSIGDWFSWIKGYDFSVGTRFHGNVAALLNGVPAVIITHDSRTKELCEFAAIPNIDIAQIGELDLGRIFCESDYERYESTYVRNHEAYADFLDENGIKHRIERGKK